MNARLILRQVRARTKQDRLIARAIPQLLTFANAALGLFAILYAVEGEITKGALCLLGSVFFDGIDGRIARALNVTSDIGCELDSLADGVSFCLAPVVLIYSQSIVISRLGIASLVLYLCAGLYRLARFNASTNNQHFNGLPTTCAAFMISTLLVFQEQIAQHAPWLVSSRGLSALLVVLSLLMISKIRIPKI